MHLSSTIHQWYPVYTQPRAEKKVYLALKNKEITCYLPLRKTLKQWSDRKKWVEEPLLPSYIFVKITEEDKATVLMTPGISRFLYFSGQIATVPERQIEDLRIWLGAELPYEVTGQHLERGQQVEVITGTLKGVKAELIDFHNAKRLVLRIESIGYALLVQVPKGYVRGI